MTRDDVLRMAQQAADETLEVIIVPHEFSIRLAALVAAAEREACAKVCEGLRHIEGQFVANEFASEVRARAVVRARDGK